MNKKLLCLLISSFLLSGCANFKKINANELAAERDAQKATEYAKKIRNNPVIQDSTKQWINTTPIIEKQVKQSAPPCPIVINTRRVHSAYENKPPARIQPKMESLLNKPGENSHDVWEEFEWGDFLLSREESLLLYTIQSERLSTDCSLFKRQPSIESALVI